jgi:hypothetical protein
MLPALEEGGVKTTEEAVLELGVYCFTVSSELYPCSSSSWLDIVILVQIEADGANMLGGL